MLSWTEAEQAGSSTHCICSEMASLARLNCSADREELPLLAAEALEPLLLLLLPALCLASAEAEAEAAAAAAAAAAALLV